MGEVPQLTAAQREKIAARLKFNPDRTDRGQLLPKTAAAWNLPAGTAQAAADRVAALVDALLSERLVVPVPVETHPDLGGDHVEQRLGEDDFIPLPTVPSVYGPAIAAFTSAQALHEWDPAARPMTMSAQRVAVLTGLMASSGCLVLNPAKQPANGPGNGPGNGAGDSPGGVLLPTPAVHALAAADVWLPAWKDDTLRTQLAAVAQESCGDVVAVKVRPAGSSPWMGQVAVDVLVQAEGAHDRGPIAAALAAVSQHPRLKTAGQKVEIIPRIVMEA